jgi:hypothetical protein
MTDTTIKMREPIASYRLSKSFGVIYRFNVRERKINQRSAH